MGFKTVGEIAAYGLAGDLKVEVYRLLKGSTDAMRDFKYRDDLRDAVSSIERNIAEGFARRSMPEFAHFLLIAFASLAETKAGVADGIDRGYFTRASTQPAFRLARQTTDVMDGLMKSLLPFVPPSSPLHGRYRQTRARRSAHRGMPDAPNRPHRPKKR